jgi:hypothetical protein
MLVFLNMLRCANQHKTDVMAAVIAGWEVLTIDARDLVFFGVNRVVQNTVDSRVLDFISGLEFISDVGHLSPLDRGDKLRVRRRE